MTPCEMLKSLRFDPYVVALKREQPRPYAAFVDILLLMEEWGTKVVAEWTDSIWAAQLGITAKQFAVYKAVYRERGLMQADTCTPVLRTKQSPSQTVKVPRKEFPSDEKRRAQRAAQKATPRSAESVRSGGGVVAESSAESSAESDLTPQNTLAVFLAEVAPEIDFTDSESLISESTQNQILKNTDSESDQNRFPSEPSAENEVLEVPSVRMVPPRSLVEQMVDHGMPRPDAESRLHEFGAERCQAALDCIRFRPTSLKKLDDPLPYIIKFLLQKFPIPAYVKRGRAAETQQNMTLLGTVSGGQSVAPATPKTQKAGSAKLPEPCRFKPGDNPAIRAYKGTGTDG